MTVGEERDVIEELRIYARQPEPVAKAWRESLSLEDVERVKAYWQECLCKMRALWAEFEVMFAVVIEEVNRRMVEMLPLIREFNRRVEEMGVSANAEEA